LCERQRCEHHVVDQRKDRGRCADAERERQQGSEREAGQLAQGAQRLAQIDEQRFHQTSHAKESLSRLAIERPNS
jgi:hypothetical protein